MSWVWPRKKKNVLRNHRVVDHVAGQVTVDLNITGSNSFDLAKKEVEDGVVPPGKPPLVQGYWDVRVTIERERGRERVC